MAQYTKSAYQLKKQKQKQTQNRVFVEFLYSQLWGWGAKIDGSMVAHWTVNLAYMMSFKPMKGPGSKDKVDSS